VAILPLVAGLGAGNLTDAADLHPVYRNAMLICAAMMVGGGVLAFFTIPDRLAKLEPDPVKTYCDPCSPPVHPRDRQAA